MPDIWMDVDTALSEVPVNLMPLIDDADFKTIEDAVAYNASGMDLRWNFVTTGGSFTSTPVTPTTSGTYDWTHQGDGIYTIEIPASGGASINNDTEGFGWFSGKATGVYPWRGPVIGFRAAALNDAMIDGGDNLDVNVTQFGGTNGTFSDGRPEVNTTHIEGADATNQLAAAAQAPFVDHSGTAQAGAAGTITLASDASSIDDYYNGAVVKIQSGTGAGQSRQITNYVGSTRVATVDSNWVTNPDNTSVVIVIGRIV